MPRDNLPAALGAVSIASEIYNLARMPGSSTSSYAAVAPSTACPWMLLSEYVLQLTCVSGQHCKGTDGHGGSS